ncbi:uncharacterized protein LOC115624269 [Scaptodrosophila lebanonensis]|uniref:Uncharacterized protein LOC115624269 n=1 Tax=Drosophila lebanonensis TaxID=7225 RepID=A0A6J2TH30_DROLE|nr:uncharacterized protein LOC115624269 [Scaptodrosophila lebanonensis]
MSVSLNPPNADLETFSLRSHDSNISRRNSKFERRSSQFMSQRQIKYSIPPDHVDTRSFASMYKRNSTDYQFVKDSYLLHEGEKVFWESFPKYVHNDSRDIPDVFPDYAKFVLPLHIYCRMRYSDSQKKYEAQFQKEIELLTESQPTASDAFGFVRIMSYTTLWPPLHTKAEVNWSSSNICQLTPKEKSRYHKIMKWNL